MRFVFVILLSLFTQLAMAAGQPTEDSLYEKGYAAYDAGDYTTARTIMEELAASGDAKAMNAIGLYYARGIAYPKDRKKACDWYEKSAKAGYNSAQYNYANCFGELGGRYKNMKDWVFWREKSAENGFKSAQTSLMKYYTDKDKTISTFWAKKAAAQGSTAARVVLWSRNQDQEIEPVTFSEITCVLIKTPIFGGTLDNCD